MNLPVKICTIMNCSSGSIVVHWE